MKNCYFHFFLLAVCFMLGACDSSSFKSDKLISITMWHVFGSQTNSPMTPLVEEFNKTVGREKRININVTSISNSTAIHFPLVAAAKNLPGAGNLPDLFVSYPKTALEIGPENLGNWNDFFSKKELEEYVPGFLEEGTFNNQLIIFPVVKSTSALFINATIFEDFSKDTGITYEDLATWEGMFKAAKAYYKWSGGKAFFKYDDWLHYSMINTASFGGTFLIDNKVNFADEHFQRIWKMLARSALAGEVCLLDGYSTTALMTGEAVCGIESTASILYFKDIVTFPDNTKIPLKLHILPVPYFTGSTPLAIQRGTGFMIAKNDYQKRQACSIFIKWLTDKEHNLPFCISTGYLPVKKSAYEQLVSERNKVYEDEKATKLYKIIPQIYEQYQFYIPPYFDGYGDFEHRFCEEQNLLFKKYKHAYTDEASLNALVDKIYNEFQKVMDIE